MVSVTMELGAENALSKNVFDGFPICHIFPEREVSICNNESG